LKIDEYEILCVGERSSVAKAAATVSMKGIGGEKPY
jgi:hypothetical protein